MITIVRRASLVCGSDRVSYGRSIANVWILKAQALLGKDTYEAVVAANSLAPIVRGFYYTTIFMAL